jgi:hypothetical protein
MPPYLYAALALVLVCRLRVALNRYIAARVASRFDDSFVLKANVLCFCICPPQSHFLGAADAYKNG